MALNSRAIRKDHLEEELNELMSVKQVVEGDLFQKYFAAPFHQELKKLKTAYDCENMYELKFQKGKYEGYSKLFSVVTEIDSRIKFIRAELEKL